MLRARQVDLRTIILLDGAEQLSRWQWFRLRRQTRQAAGLVITDHAPGRLPTLLECRTSPELLSEIVSELLGDEARGCFPRAEKLLRDHRGNIRDVLRALYDERAAQ